MKVISKVRTALANDVEARTTAINIGHDILRIANGAIENSGNYRLARAVTVGSVLFSLGKAIKSFHSVVNKPEEPSFYIINIDDEERVYDVVEDWVLKAIPEENKRVVNAQSVITKAPPKDKRNRKELTNQELASWEAELMSEIDGRPDRVVVDFYFDGKYVQELEIAGHKVTVYTNIDGGADEKNDNKGGYKPSISVRRMQLVVDSLEARDAVLEEIEKHSQHLVSTQPRMFVSSRWGDFRRRSEIQTRSRDSVILKEGQMDRIVGYLKDFLDNRPAYQKADIPFRTGILLSGDPGSGKSSTALAIANELRMNVYIIALSSLLNDEALNDCFQNVPANSIIILEDIDIASAVKDRDADDSTGVTMAGMLNVLDGFQSPPGVITIMTTNRKDVLDPAMIRPGRVDLEEVLDCLDSYQLEGLCKYFMGKVPENLPTITPEDKITSAQVMGVIRKHLPDFAEAADDVVQFVVDRKAENMEKAEAEALTREAA